MIERYLEDVGAATEQGCRGLSGGLLDQLAAGLVDVFVEAKCKRIEVSRAIHEPLGRIGGGLAKAAGVKAAEPVAAALRSCSDASFPDVDPVLRFLVLACGSLLTSAIADQADVLDRGSLWAHMQAMSLGYLRQAADRNG